MNNEYHNRNRMAQWMIIASAISWASTAIAFALALWQWGKLDETLQANDASMTDILLLGPSAIATSWLPLAMLLLIASCALTAFAFKAIAERSKAWTAMKSETEER